MKPRIPDNEKQIAWFIGDYKGRKRLYFSLRIAAATGIEPPLVDAILGEMLANGWIQPKGGRFSLTDAGRTHYKYKPPPLVVKSVVGHYGTKTGG